MSEWPLKYQGVEIHFDDPEEVKKWGVLVSQTEKTMIDNISKSLYGPNALLDDMMKNVKPPTMLERLKAFGRRAKDAWLVLTGKLDPYDSW